MTAMVMMMTLTRLTEGSSYHEKHFWRKLEERERHFIGALSVLSTLLKKSPTGVTLYFKSVTPGRRSEFRVVLSETQREPTAQKARIPDVRAAEDRFEVVEEQLVG